MKAAKPRAAKRARNIPKIIPTPAAAAPLRPGPVAAARTTPLGRRLAELRGDRPLHEAAAQAGASIANWRRWETGEATPSLAQLAEIGRAFGVAPLDLAAVALGEGERS